jgi:hypothetical protein
MSDFHNHGTIRGDTYQFYRGTARLFRGNARPEWRRANKKVHYKKELIFTTSVPGFEW